LRTDIEIASGRTGDFPMKPHILQIGPMMPHVEAGLAGIGTVHKYWQATDRTALIDEHGPAIHGVATDGHHGLAPEILARLPQLKIIASYGVGYDAIDIPACKALDVRVTNTPDVLNDAMAEITLGLMIALCRRLPQADAFVRSGKWPDGGFGLTGELTGAHAGILGLGRIGTEIARRLQAFKMRVSYHGRREQPFQPWRYYGDLSEMTRDVDWLIVIAPSTAETRHIVSRDIMAALGPDGSLVNVSRGSLVDEQAMVGMLQSGELGGAALDVFEAEPDVPKALFSMPNVVLSPHQGSATTKTRRAMGDLVVANLTAHFSGDPLLTPVV
jgi:lactate dehydrogenase-like 2-hydroxyacid dehydrogenase